MIFHTNSKYYCETVIIDPVPATFAWQPKTPGGISDFGVLPGAPTQDVEIGDEWNGYTLVLKDEQGNPEDTTNWGWRLDSASQAMLNGAPQNPTEGQEYLDFRYEKLTEAVPRKAYCKVAENGTDVVKARFDVFQASEVDRQKQRAIQRADWLEANPDPVPNPEPTADIFA